MADMIATIKMDASEVHAAIARAETLFPKLGKPGAELVQSFLGRVDLGDEAAFVIGECQPAGVTGEIVVSLKPSPAFLDLIAALEAGDA